MTALAVLTERGIKTMKTVSICRNVAIEVRPKGGQRPIRSMIFMQQRVLEQHAHDRAVSSTPLPGQPSNVHAFFNNR